MDSVDVPIYISTEAVYCVLLASYGTSRVGSRDYVYQGGCGGELSLWGEHKILGDFQCKIWNGKEKEIDVGRWSPVGHCVRESQVTTIHNVLLS